MAKQQKGSSKKQILTKHLVPKNHINRLTIKNFKSIKHMSLKPKRINIFIGRPNVGKSNVLEAIALMAGYYSTHIVHHSPKDKYLRDLIRYENFDELFYDGFTGYPIEIDSDLAYATIHQQHNPGLFHYIIADSSDVNSFVKYESVQETEYRFDEYLASLDSSKIESRVTNSYQVIYQSGQIDQHRNILSARNPIKKYEFAKQSSFPNRYHYFLLPPHGENLYTVVRLNKKLQKEIADIFKEYKLDFIIKAKDPVFEVQKKVRNLAVSYPYSGIADTLQRYIFHLAAIRSNRDSVILFEEPETHNFPAYVRQLAEDIIADKNNNQYFITTHSAFILNVLLENSKDDVAVYKLAYKNYQTVAEELDEQTIRKMLNYGSDIFFKL